MTLKIHKGSDTLFQSYVSSFFVENGKILMYFDNGKEVCTSFNGVTFFSKEDFWQDDEEYIGVLPLSEIK